MPLSRALYYLVSVPLSFTVIVDFIYLIRCAYLPDTIRYTACVVSSSLVLCNILESVCILRGLLRASQVSACITFLLLGYSLPLLLHCNSYVIIPRDPYLLIISGLASCLVLLCPFTTDICSQSAQIYRCFYYLTCFLLWLGFALGSFHCTNPLNPLHFICLVFVYWVLFHQVSYLCILLFIVNIGVYLVLIIPRWFVTDAIVTFFTPYSSLVCFLLAVYTFYVMVPHLFRSFSAYHLTYRWYFVINAWHSARCFVILVLFTLQLGYFVQSVLALVQMNNKEVRITIFLASAFVWSVSHVITGVIWCHLSREVSSYISSDPPGGRSLDLWNLSSKGFRHFGHIAYPFVSCSGLCTLVLLGVTFPNVLFGFSLLQISLPAEVCLYSFVRELTQNSGSTCVGAALVVEPSFVSTTHEDRQSRPFGNRLLKNFAHHRFPLIQLLRSFFHALNIYNSQGLNSLLEAPSIENALSDTNGTYSTVRTCVLRDLANFFRQCLPNTGIRFDTYFLYYCGPTTLEGDWLMEDGTSINLESLVDLWQMTLKDCGVDPQNCRLLLFIDAPYAMCWYKKLRYLYTPSIIALQTAEATVGTRGTSGYIHGLISWLLLLIQTRSGSEVHHAHPTGEFTRLWINWNLLSVRGMFDPIQSMENTADEQTMHQNEYSDSTDSLLVSPNQSQFHFKPVSILISYGRELKRLKIS